MTAAQGEAVWSPSALAARLAYVYRPADYLHPSWWRPDWLEPAAFEALRRSARARFDLSRFLLKQFAIGEPAAGDFDDPCSRIGLLAPEDLKRLVRFAGLTLACEGIDRVILARERRLVREALGDSDYDFARKRASRLRKRLVAAGTEASPKAFDFGDLEDWEIRSRQCGISSLAELTAHLSGPWHQRLVLRLPASWADDFAAALASVEGEGNARLLRFWQGLARELAVPWPN